MPAIVLHAEAAAQVAALLQVPPRGLVRWRDLRPVLEIILRHLRTDISAEGLRLKALPDGVHIEPGTGSASVMRHAHLPLHQEMRMQPDRRIAGWRTLAPMLHSIVRCLPFHFSVDGLTLHQLPGGIHLGAGGAGAASFTHQAQAREMLRGLPDRGMVGWSRLTPPLKRLTAALTLKVDAEGMEASATAHGLHLRLITQTGGANTTPPEILGFSTYLTEDTTVPYELTRYQGDPVAEWYVYVLYNHASVSMDGFGIEWFILIAGTPVSIGTGQYITITNNSVPSDETYRCVITNDYGSAQADVRFVVV